MPYSDFKLGSDPEVMLADRNGNLLSAIPIVPGTKLAPTNLHDGTMQHDNVNLEFGITPASTEEEWVSKHGAVLRQLANFLGRDVIMVVRASADFPDSQLNCKEAREFGCDPDFDPYTMSINTVPPDAAESNLRTCGGHIHIGNDQIAEDIDAQANIAKVMDIFLGIPSLLLDKDPTSPRRRQLYGKAGAHRPKSYGVEYRSIGNFWVSHPDLSRLIYKLTRDGLVAAGAGHTAGINPKMIRAVINKNMVDKAEAVIKDFVIPLLADDTRKLLGKCLEMPQVDIYDGWNLAR